MNGIFYIQTWTLNTIYRRLFSTWIWNLYPHVYPFFFCLWLGVISLLEHDEDYVITFPSTFCRYVESGRFFLIIYLSSFLNCRNLMVPFWNDPAAHQFGQAIICILVRRRTKIAMMARPNEPDMPSRRTKKGIISVYRTQSRQSGHDIVAIRSVTVDSGQWTVDSGQWTRLLIWLIANLCTVMYKAS